MTSLVTSRPRPPSRSPSLSLELEELSSQVAGAFKHHSLGRLKLHFLIWRTPSYFVLRWLPWPPWSCSNPPPPTRFRNCWRRRQVKYRECSNTKRWEDKRRFFMGREAILILCYKKTFTPMLEVWPMLVDEPDSLRRSVEPSGPPAALTVN